MLRVSRLAAVVVGMSVALGFGASAWASGARAAAAVPPSQPPSPSQLIPFKQKPAQTNSTFVPVAPCRIVSTSATGKLGNGTTKTYSVGGTTGFTGQGGQNGGCGIPISATAIAATINALNTGARGYVRAWAADAAEPAVSFLNYPANSVATGTGATIPVAQGVAQSLKVKNYGGPTNLNIFVSGYYVPPMAGMVSPSSSTDSTHNAPIFAGSSRIVSATNPSTGVYVVTFDSTITYCTPMVDTYNAGAGICGAAYAFSGNTATVFTWYLNATTHQETLYSYYFYIAIIC